MVTGGLRSGLVTVQEAAEATGWSARMLRYVEQRELVRPARSPSGYRLYGVVELERLRSLRRLLDETGLELADVAAALRLRRDPSLRERVESWLADADESTASSPAERALAALQWEQERSARLLRAAEGSRHDVKVAVEIPEEHA
jgi:adenosylhomocysteinase